MTNKKTELSEKMKFCDTAYAGRKLKVDAVHPVTGALIIPSRRTLTKKLVMKAYECGAILTEDMIHTDGRRKTSAEKTVINGKRIKWLKGKIAKYQAELDSFSA